MLVEKELLFQMSNSGIDEKKLVGSQSGRYRYRSFESAHELTKYKWVLQCRRAAEVRGMERARAHFVRDSSQFPTGALSLPI
jgi:hypothetical protein